MEGKFATIQNHNTSTHPPSLQLLVAANGQLWRQVWRSQLWQLPQQLQLRCRIRAPQPHLRRQSCKFCLKLFTNTIFFIIFLIFSAVIFVCYCCFPRVVVCVYYVHIVVTWHKKDDLTLWKFSLLQFLIVCLFSIFLLLISYRNTEQLPMGL